MKNNPWTIDRACVVVRGLLQKLFPNDIISIECDSHTASIALLGKQFPVIKISKDNTTQQLTDKVNEAVSEYCAKNSNKSR